MTAGEREARFQVKSGPVTPAQALDCAYDLETAIGEVANGTRKPEKLPVEPIVKLIQYVRDLCESALSREVQPVAQPVAWRRRIRQTWGEYWDYRDDEKVPFREHEGGSDGDQISDVIPLYAAQAVALAPTDAPGLRVGAIWKDRVVDHSNAPSDDLLLRFLSDLHSHLSEDERPMSWSDFSGEQALRARVAWSRLGASLCDKPAAPLNAPYVSNAIPGDHAAGQPILSIAPCRLCDGNKCTTNCDHEELIRQAADLHQLLDRYGAERDCNDDWVPIPWTLYARVEQLMMRHDVVAAPIQPTSEEQP